MWIVLGLGSVLHCAGSLGLRFCIGSFFKTSFNSTLLRISTLDSVNVLDSESALDSPNSALFRFCLCSLLRISLDSVIVSESKWLDSVNVLDSVFPRFSALDSESALDSIDSKFLRVVFSRILSNFLESCVFSQKGVFPSPQPRKSLRCFCCAALASLWHGKRGECLAFSLSRQKC